MFVPLLPKLYRALAHPASLATIAFVMLGAWNLHSHSRYWAGAKEHIPATQLFLQIFITILLDCTAGGVMASIAKTLKVLLRRKVLSIPSAFFIGINFTALLVLWVIPKLA